LQDRNAENLNAAHLPAIAAVAPIPAAVAPITTPITTPAATTAAPTTAASVAAPAAAVASSAPAWSPAATPASAFGLWPRFIHYQVAAAKVLAIEGVHSAISIFVIIYFYKREPARLSGEAVTNQINA
jgi:hypothetical protein